jgi:hypothetical protein
MLHLSSPLKWALKIWVARRVSTFNGFCSI